MARDDERPSADAEQTLNNYLRILSRRDSPFAEVAPSSARLQSQLLRDSSPPFRVYSADLDSIASGVAVQHAQMIGWRFVVSGGVNGPGWVQVAHRPKGETDGFNLYNEGHLVDAALTSIARVTAAAPPSRYDIRFLDAPAVYGMAVWAADVEGEDDFFLVVSPPSLSRAFESGRLSSRELEVALVTLERRLRESRGTT